MSQPLMGHCKSEKHMGTSAAHDYDGHSLSLSLGSERSVVEHCLKIPRMPGTRPCAGGELCCGDLPRPVWTVPDSSACSASFLPQSPIPRLPDLPPHLFRRLLPAASAVIWAYKEGATVCPHFPCRVNPVTMDGSQPPGCGRLCSHEGRKWSFPSPRAG